MDLSARYDPSEVEAKVLKKWLKGSLFSAKKNSTKKPYSIVIPPPNITGILHMGHALNNTIQDVLVRYKRLSGYESLWMPGTDHAGIATQNVLERTLAKEGLTKEELGREEFIRRLWSWQKEYGTTIVDQLKKIGASCDWQRLRFTMDEPYSDAVKEVFLRLFEKGLIYRGNYIINWCPRCRTALSDEEAEHQEIDAWLYYIRYPVFDSQGSRKWIVVATTRPETMLGDTAVAINPADSRYSWLSQSIVTLPILDRKLRVIEDDAIDPDFGTGVVKVTPAHDPLDFQLGKKYQLEFINIMDEAGNLNLNVPLEFQGLGRFQAREVLIKKLEKEGFLEKKEAYRLGAGHCYRCKTIVEPRMSLQWFVKMKPLSKPAIQAVEENKVNFYPKRWKKVYLNWMHNIQDWCISRQIWWGHRIPVWYCDLCYNWQRPKGSSLSSERRGIIAAKEKPDKCPDCGSVDLRQDKDVLDTWFSSWLWPFATFGWPFGDREDREKKLEDRKREDEFRYFYPTSTLVTASEILFFWVARMIMASFEFTGQIPFADVFIHGTVRDAKGVKMSKSLGNTIDPLEIIKEYGTDALRFSLMFLAAGGCDVYLSADKFLIGRNFSNKLWNANRFIFSKITAEKIDIFDLSYSFEDESDAWVLDKLNDTILNYSASLDKYRLDEAIKQAYDFFWHTFCDWYLEIIKDNFNQKKAKNSLFILISALKLLHPFIPFITEEIFTLVKENTSLELEDFLLQSRWPKKEEIKAAPEKIDLFASLVELVDSIRDLRGDLALGQEKIALEIKANSDLEFFWHKHKNWFSRLSGASQAVFKGSLERVFYQNRHWSVNLRVDSGDLESFAVSLDKKISNLDSLLKKVEIKLANESFITNAPFEIVEKEKIKKADLCRKLERLKKLREIAIK